MKNLLSLVLIVLFPLIGIAQKNDKALAKIIKKNKKLSSVLDQKDKYRLQIIYTSVKNGKPGKSLFFNVDPDKYFYPASTVKLPAVLLSLEKLNSIEAIDQETPFRVLSPWPEYPSAYFDSTAKNLLPSIEHYAKKILLVSDNDAFNRLYDFLGPKAFNEQMQAKGFKNTRINHRLSISLPSEINTSKPAFAFGAINTIKAIPSYVTTDRMEVATAEAIYFENASLNEVKSSKTPEPVLIGKAYISGGELVNEAMDFASKNAYGLEDQHQLIKSLFFPNSVQANMKFNLTQEQDKFVKKYMSIPPRESDYPKYDESEYFDSYVKFFLFGDQKTRTPDHIKIYNKVGQAYGFLIDNAYIQDTKNNVSFFLSAVIYCNEDGVLNDNKYEYDEVGFPFLAELGRTIHDYELKKKK